MHFKHENDVMGWHGTRTMLCLQLQWNRHLQPSCEKVFDATNSSYNAIQVAAQMNDHGIADEPEHIGGYMSVALMYTPSLSAYS